MRRGDGKVDIHCHKCDGDDQYLTAIGWTAADLYDEPRERGQGPSTALPRPRPKPSRPKTPRARTKAKRPLRGETASYPYCDEDGVLLFEVVRIEIPGQKKTFQQISADGYYGTSGIRRVLYRLPGVIKAAQAGEIVAVAEGEKDVETLAAMGITATTMPGGSGMGWSDDYTQSLKGAVEVIVIADNDESGLAHAETVAASLDRHGIGYRVLVSDRAKDITDHVAAGGTLEDLVPVEAPSAAPATFNDYLAQRGPTDAGLNAVRHHSADDSTRKPEPTQGLATLSESPNMRLPETFWSKSTQLTAIREAARRRHNSPEMLMVIVLTRIAALCGPTVRVATGAGDPATLSVFGAGVGESGSGKGRGDKTGRKLVPFDYKTLGEDFVSIGISTGRGITAAFLAKKEVQLGHPDFDEEADAKGKPQEKRLTQVATRAYATEDEGSTMMAAIQSKHGADIPGTLCKCWIGEEHRQSNATEELRRSLDADSYTMSMFATFQPEPAAELLATGSIGLPQRTLFTLAYRSEEEIEATRDRTEITDADWDDYGDDRQQNFVHVAELIAPGTNGMTVAKFAENLRDVVIRLPVAAQREIARMIADGESRETTVHPLDKHRPLQLAKTAAVFALLHGETAVRRLHWEMANDLWGVSAAVRSMIEALAETKVRQAAEARRADAVATSRAVKAAEIEVETGANPVVVRLARKLARKLQAKGPMRSSDAQRGLITGADRRAYQETGADAPVWPAVARYASDSGIVSIDGDGVFSVV
ncbi:hypothetical protein [Streptomyces torulosus]|uniref:hypothetical protein n=1 Tax=Streptomyces torulosus TaxID=68276 RepID=UPI0012FF2D03|nr:hypothetical protein [Streptomyces torulosus]